MVFKKMLSAVGVGGPSVDTVVDNPHCRPGETLHGQIHLTGGKSPAEIEYVALGLVTRIEVESGGSEYDSAVELHRLQAPRRSRSWARSTSSGSVQER